MPATTKSSSPKDLTLIVISSGSLRRRSSLDSGVVRGGKVPLQLVASPLHPGDEELCIDALLEAIQ